MTYERETVSFENCLVLIFESQALSIMAANGTILSDSDAVQQTKLILNVYVDSTLCALGFVGNILILFILNTEKNANSNIFLTKVLAVYDTLYLSHASIYIVLRTALQCYGYQEVYQATNPYILMVSLPFGWIAQTGTIWVTVLLAVDRHWAVSRPLQALSVCTVRNARIAAGVTSLLVVLFNLPRFPYYYRVATQTAINDTFVAHVRVDLPNWNEDVYRYLYHISLTLIFLYIIPLTALAIFNVLLIRVLREAKRTRQRLSVVATSSPQRKASASTVHNAAITFNLVVIITKFIVCETPDFVAAMLASDKRISTTDEFKVYNALKETLLILNSVLNFYIYCAFNRRFRAALRTCCCERLDAHSRRRNSSTAHASCSSITQPPTRVSTSVSSLSGVVHKGTQTENNAAAGSQFW